jgi:hypothetical protein
MEDDLKILSHRHLGCSSNIEDLYKTYEILRLNAVSDCTSCTPVNGTELKQNLTILMRYLDLVFNKGSILKYSYT